MKIAVHGLGRMGMQIARKLVEGGHNVAAHNRSIEPINEAVAYGALSCQTKQDVVDFFGDEQVIIWVMLPSEVTDDQVSEWSNLLPAGSLIVNGANSDFRHTTALNENLKAAGHRFVDIGVSGGVWGYQNGFCMMGGSDNPDDWELLRPVLETLSKDNGSYEYFGPSGSGNYVKMIHNAIEYGMMQSLAEGYRMLKEGPYSGIDLSKAGYLWQHQSVIRSWLNELTADALKENPKLEGLTGYVAENGETKWALEVAKELGIDIPAIQAAYDVRIKSQQGETNFATKVIAAQRNKFGGHNLNGEGRA